LSKWTQFLPTTEPETQLSWHDNKQNEKPSAAFYDVTQ